MMVSEFWTILDNPWRLFSNPYLVTKFLGRPFVKQFALCYQTIVCPVRSTCNIGVLWPNSWTDQDATWYGGRHRPRPHLARWGTSSPPKKRGHSPQFSVQVYCGQTAVCIRIPLGTQVDLSLGVIVLDGDPAPHPLKGHSPSPNFQPMSDVAKWMDGLRCHLVWRYASV